MNKKQEHYVLGYGSGHSYLVRSGEYKKKKAIMRDMTSLITFPSKDDAQAYIIEKGLSKTSFRRFSAAFPGIKFPFQDAVEVAPDGQPEPLSTLEVASPESDCVLVELIDTEQREDNVVPTMLCLPPMDKHMYCNSELIFRLLSVSKEMFELLKIWQQEKERAANIVRISQLKICDWNHDVELNEITVGESYQLLQQLKAIQDERRVAKNEMKALETLGSALNKINLRELETAIHHVEGLAYQKYRHRIDENGNPTQPQIKTSIA